MGEIPTLSHCDFPTTEKNKKHPALCRVLLSKVDVLLNSHLSDCVTYTHDVDATIEVCDAHFALC